MAKRTDIKKILIIGSGPVTIGQTGEFDYASVQAAEAIKGLGFETVIVNSGLSSPLTDPERASASYIEPLNFQRIVKTIEKERPDALYPAVGGQTGLNLCSELYNSGILDQYSITVLGVSPEATQKSEDRIAFKELLSDLLIDSLPSVPAYTIDEAEKIAEGLGFPVVVRAAYTLGGIGGGVVYNSEELKTVVSQGFRASIVGQVMVEQSVLDWQELELEVLRDSKGNKITAAFIENIDPMGIHTGDSIAVSPMMTISAEVQGKLEDMAFKLADALAVNGSANIQFAYDSASGRIVVIEINVRASRTSAFASKASGIPLSEIAAKLACGITLEEITDNIFGTLAKYVQGNAFTAVKFPRWGFEKYAGTSDKLSTQMKAIGQSVGIGNNFAEALQKAVCGLEKGRFGLGLVPQLEKLSADELLDKLREPSSDRFFIIYESLKKGVAVADIVHLTKINPFFLTELQALVEEEKTMAASGLSAEVLSKAKKNGFSDKYLSLLTGKTEDEMKSLYSVKAGTHKIASHGADKGYYYSSYSDNGNVVSTGKKKILILGSGPDRIGQGTEFDYSALHGLKAFSELGFETILVSCDPEAVSTSFLYADKIYVEPLTAEAVLCIIDAEKPDGIVAQFGGVAALELSSKLEKAGLTVLGVPSASYQLTTDRGSLFNTLKEINIRMPELGVATSSVEALSLSEKIGFPLMARPLYSGAKAKTEVIYDEGSLKELVLSSNDISLKKPLLIERFLNSAFEFEVDAVSDGQNVYIPAVMEHIELAGVHSGDSALVLPSCTLTESQLKEAKACTAKISEALNIKGLFNIEFALENGTLYVLEVRFGASRTVPFLAKSTGINLSELAAKVLALPLIGGQSPLVTQENINLSYYAVKEAVFPFGILPDVDPLLGPEMRSTGAVLGLGTTLEEAYYKAQEATGVSLPTYGTVFISVNDRDKAEVVSLASDFEKAGFTILATGGTYTLLNKNGIKAKRIDKLKEGRPNIYDAIVNRQVDLVVNTPTDIKSSVDDDSYIRKAAIRYGINYITTLAAAKVAVKAIRSKADGVKSLQEYLK